MYATNDERLDVAHQAWEQVSRQREAISRKMDRCDKRGIKATGVEYALICAEIEMLRVQYEAVCALCNERWNHYEILLNT